MKKVGISFIIIIIIEILGSFCCYAKDRNQKIEVELKGATKIQQTDKTYIATILLGDFKEIADPRVLGYEATLNYDEEVFESVEVKGLNGWAANYKDSTKMLIGDTSSAKANTEITQIIFTRKEDVRVDTTEITLNPMLVTDDENDFQYDKKITIDIQEKEKENPVANNTTNPKKETEPEKNTDHSIAKKELPRAGMGIIIVISILFFIIIVFVSGRSYIGYLKDIRKQMKK